MPRFQAVLALVDLGRIPGAQVIPAGRPALPGLKRLAELHAAAVDLVLAVHDLVAELALRVATLLLRRRRRRGIAARKPTFRLKCFESRPWRSSPGLSWPASGAGVAVDHVA